MQQVPPEEYEVLDYTTQPWTFDDWESTLWVGVETDDLRDWDHLVRCEVPLYSSTDFGENQENGILELIGHKVIYINGPADLARLTEEERQHYDEQSDVVEGATYIIQLAVERQQPYDYDAE